MQYHKLTKVFSQLANTNPRLNIWDRISIISNVNEYLMGNGSCEPLSFTNAIKNIKNLIYNNSL